MIAISTEKGTLIMNWRVGYPVPTGLLSAEKVLEFRASGPELEIVLAAMRRQSRNARARGIFEARLQAKRNERRVPENPSDMSDWA